MSLKYRLLKLLEEAGETDVSGSALASELSVSRNAIWKAVQVLRAEGYEIAAVTNKGYRLLSSGDVFSGNEISRYVRTQGVFTIETRKTVSSTNTVLRELAPGGLPEGYVIAAEEQTAGKGRLGRGFHSPAGCGVYFSMLLRPALNSSGTTLITSAAAVATARAIYEVFGIQVGIKWVNDLFVDDKKVCGILTEATMDMESWSVESAVLGVGINITEPEEGYPEEISKVTAALSLVKPGKDSGRCRLIASVLDHFWAIYTRISDREFLSEYRSRSIVIGRDIYVLSGNEQKPAFVLAIDDECRLIVRYCDGGIATLSTGEVSIRAV